MNVLIYLIPIALAMGGLGLATFLWSLKSGQYDDLEGSSWRVLDDGDDRPRHRLNRFALARGGIECQKRLQ